MADEKEAWQRERAQLRKQITDLERIKHDLEGRLFDALKTDKWLAAGLQEVDHAADLSRGVYSRVLDVACVAVARVKELEAASGVQPARVPPVAWLDKLGEPHRRQEDAYEPGDEFKGEPLYRAADAGVQEGGNG